MGTGITQVLAAAGHPVHLMDAQAGAADSALQSLSASLERLTQRDQITGDQASETLSRVTAYPTGDLGALPPVGLVMEAVVEHLDIKRALFRELEATQPATTILASNTSSINLDLIAGPATSGHDAASQGGYSPAMTHPGRLIGLHFFNPAPRMALVEVVGGTASDETVLDSAMDLVRGWGKTPVRCTSTPGFIVNRIARPFYGEAQRMLSEGVADATTIDLALRRAGFPMGPFELADLVGQDVNLAVTESIWRQTGKDSRYAPTDWQRELVRAGRWGRKSAHGVYRYGADGRALDQDPDEEWADRLVGGELLTDPVARTITMIVNEAVDLVVRGEASAEDVDIAMRLGTHYPHGPFEWLAQWGAATIKENLATLDRTFPGGRYRPSPGLDR